MKFFKLRSIIISFSFLLTSIVLIIDNQPQVFPLLESEDTPDCLSIDVINISNEINRIRLFMRARSPFIEFPIEAASHLIKVKADSSIASFTYRYSDFRDYEAFYKKGSNSTGTEDDFDFLDFDFSILHPISGNVSLSVFCNKFKLEKEEIDLNRKKSKFISSFNFSIDKIKCYQVGLSKIEFNDMNSFTISQFSIFNSNIVFHTRNLVDFRQIRIGKRNYNVSVDLRNFVQFCDLTNQKYDNDEIFIVSSESLNELNSQSFFTYCILKIFYSTIKIENEIKQYIETVNNSEVINSTLVDDVSNSNLYSLSNSILFNKNDISTESNEIKMKLFIINENVKNEKIPISNNKYQNFELLFGPGSIEIVNMIDKRCLREGVFLSFENEDENNIFLSEVEDELFNVSLLKSKFISSDQDLNNSDRIKILIDDDKNSSDKFVILDISDNISEIAIKVNLCDRFIVTQSKNLPFALFMNEGAELVQVGGNKFVGQKIANLTKINKFTYCDNETNCEN